MKRTAEELAALSRLLDEALELPTSAQERWVESLEGKDAGLRDTLRAMLASARGSEMRESGRQKQSMACFVEGALQTAGTGLRAGSRVGPYRLVREIGRGGMGSVWLAERADGAFFRAVALKLPSLAWQQDLVARMARERDILASLQHEHIARFYDAGVDGSGRPYIAMEYIEGVAIDEYCRERKLGVDAILSLVLQVCRALAHAHSRLIVHRDLKPGNILVSDERGVSLLDFGVAALLSEQSDAPATQFAGRMLTPHYCSPEQIRGEVIGTSSDVYSLAVMTYELLCGRKPYEFGRGSLAAIAKAIEDTVPSLASTAAPAASRKRLRGDLDAILAKALKKEPAERYPSMAEFAEDLERHLKQLPVRARPDRAAYRVRKFVGRYRFQLGAAAVVFLAVIAGGAVAIWQAHAALLEARRADAIKDFLVDILRANDVRVATDGGHGERTVKDVMDTAAAGIDSRFAGQPELKLELLDLLATIYLDSNEFDRYHRMENRRAALAESFYGPGHPLVIRGLLEAAESAVDIGELPAAKRLLDSVAQNLGDPELRAFWLKTKASYLGQTGDTAEHDHLLEQAVSLYRKAGHDSTDFSSALSSLAITRGQQGRTAESLALMREAIKVGERVRTPNYAFLPDLHLNLGRALERTTGGTAEAHAHFQQARDLSLRTWGKQGRDYWISLAWDAALLQETGDRPSANALLAELAASLPADIDSYAAQLARHYYATCLVRDGRAAQAVPILESIQNTYLVAVNDASDLRHLRLDLGEAYERDGRLADARVVLQKSRDEYVAREPAGTRNQLRARERWGRFLLDHARAGSTDLEDAESEFRAVLAATSHRIDVWLPLAHAGLGQIALMRGRTAEASAHSAESLVKLAQVDGLYDVRLRDRLWLVHGDTLLATGDVAGARAWAVKARDASERLEEPLSPNQVRAAAAIQLADARGT